MEKYAVQGDEEGWAASDKERLHLSSGLGDEPSEPGAISSGDLEQEGGLVQCHLRKAQVVEASAVSRT